MLYASSSRGGSCVLGCVVEGPQPPAPGRQQRRPPGPALHLTLAPPAASAVPAAMSKLPPFRTIASLVGEPTPDPRLQQPFVPQKRPLPPPPPPPPLPPYPQGPPPPAYLPPAQDLAALKRPRVELGRETPYVEASRLPYSQPYAAPAAGMMRPPPADPAQTAAFAPQGSLWGLPPAGTVGSPVSGAPQDYVVQTQGEVDVAAQEGIRGGAALDSPAYSVVSSSRSSQLYQGQQQAAPGGMRYAEVCRDPQYVDGREHIAPGLSERARGMERAGMRTLGAPGRELVRRGMGGLAGVAQQEVMGVQGPGKEVLTEREALNLGQPGADGRYSCPECNKTLLNPTTLQNHIKSVHQNAGTYVCKYCPNGRNNFMWKSTLDIHISHVHEKKRPFKCTIGNCQNSFRWGSHLKEHILVQHNFRKDFTCPICPKTFGRKNNWLKHIRNVHKVKDVQALLTRMRWEIPKPAMPTPEELEDMRREAAARAPGHLGGPSRELLQPRAQRTEGCAASSERELPKGKRDSGSVETSPRSRRRKGNQQAFKREQPRHQEQANNTPSVLGKA